MHHDSASVANDFRQGTDSERDPKGPCLVTDALDEIDETTKAEDCAEDKIGGKRGSVAVDGEVIGAVVVDIGTILGAETRRWKDTTIGRVGLRT